ncbi:MAG: hypothetical protein LBM70_08080 [Victivallales bacterium]|jgi:hypothetical protein|nr:hypothetical protein [Victivallales bacterium]
MKRIHLQRLLLGGVAAIGGPALFYLQSSYPTTSKYPVEPAWSKEELLSRELATLGDDVIHGSMGGIARFATYLIRIGDRETAESWIRYGASQLKGPALMLFYADFLRNRGDIPGMIRANYWYARAELTIPANPNADQIKFLQTVRQHHQSLQSELNKNER